VHILNLEGHWAFCLPLPKVLWDAPAGEQAMAASVDGTRCSWSIRHATP
jgi:hypothetical protein